jgi:hypothetical protein
VWLQAKCRAAGGSPWLAEVQYVQQETCSPEEAARLSGRLAKICALTERIERAPYVPGAGPEGHGRRGQ